MELMGRGVSSAGMGRHQVTASSWVVPEPARCVQCGICSFYCPIDIDVRRHVWRHEPVKDGHCLTCGECVARCPRSVLRFEAIAVPGEGGHR
jgi:Pyruvate/2-oxoacid:ferredoxin oxidoreductase delta subunit